MIGWFFWGDTTIDCFFSWWI